MKILRTALILTAAILATSACTPTGSGGTTPAPTVPVVENTTEAAPTAVETEPPTEEAVVQPTEEMVDIAIHPQIPVLGQPGLFEITLTRIGFDYSTAFPDAVSQYTAAMEARNCNAASETGSDSGAIAVLFLCTNADGGILGDFSMVVQDYGESASVSFTLASPEVIEFDLPIPDDAEDLETNPAGATFHLGPEGTNVFEFYGEIFDTMGCTEGPHAGGPSGFRGSYYCVDEAGHVEKVFGLGLTYLEGDDGASLGTDVSIDVGPMTEGIRFSLPEDAVGDSFSLENGLAFHLPWTLAEASEYFTSPDYYDVESCSLVGEAGSPNGALALRYLCTNYVGVEIQFETTIVITETETGSDVVLKIDLQ